MLLDNFIKSFNPFRSDHILAIPIMENLSFLSFFILVGEKTFITIRNVPYTELEIVDVKKEAMKEMFFNYDRPEVPYLMNNGAYPHRFQYVVTVRDEAQITQDGAVVGGNKIKIGLPVDLEGFNYRLGGMVSDVKIIEEEK